MKNRTKNKEQRTKTEDASGKTKEQRAKSKDKKITDKVILVLSSLFLALFLFTAAEAAKWGGVDESVVEKYAEEHGRAARDPFINTDQGDLLLFVFLLAGAVGGFAAGYYWRELMENGRTKNKEPRTKTKERKNYA